MVIEGIDVFTDAAFERGMGEMLQRGDAERAVQHPERRISRLDTERKRLGSGGKKPGRPVESIVGLIEKFPGENPAAILSGQPLRRFVHRRQIIRKVIRRPRPRRRHVENRADPDAAFLQQSGVAFVNSGIENVAFRFDMFPAETVADHTETGPAAEFADRFVLLARKAFVPLLRAGEPALRRIHGEKAFRIRFPRRGVRNDRKAHRFAEFPAVRLERQRIIAARQLRQRQQPASVLRPGSRGNGLSGPVRNPVTQISRDRSAKLEPDRFGVVKNSGDRFALHRHHDRQRRKQRRIDRPAVRNQPETAHPKRGFPGILRVQADRKRPQRCGIGRVQLHTHAPPLRAGNRIGEITPAGNHEGVSDAARTIRLHLERKLRAACRRIELPQRENRIEPEIPGFGKEGFEPHSAVLLHDVQFSRSVFRPVLRPVHPSCPFGLRRRDPEHDSAQHRKKSGSNQKMSHRPHPPMLTAVPGTFLRINHPSINAHYDLYLIMTNYIIKSNSERQNF